MIEVPSPLSDLVKIRHPRYEEDFKKLDLRWVAAPALTRLGFDIGGVQYTATPFIGWFMDAEVGVRDLADTFRYNALPEVAKALGLFDGRAEGVEGLEDLPEYEQLSILTRAQTELTYAVNWSYQQARVSMTDTLTASMKWCRYDDDFKAKNGFRLPADPYWLAPPQGSIVPVWHRGGAPNYQPKPMICRHVQDPLNAWLRENQDGFVAAKTLSAAVIMQPKRPPLQGRSITNDCYSNTPNGCHVPDVTKSETYRETHDLTTAAKGQSSARIQTEQNDLSVSVYFCSAGTFAEKLAMKLHSRLSDMAENTPNVSVCSTVKALNKLQSSTIQSNELILAVVSSTGQGEVPPNGSQFIKMQHREERLKILNTSFKYAIYGNGDSRYSATYNGAAVVIDQKFRKIGGLPLTSGLYQGDTALHMTALQALSPWWAKLQPTIRDLAVDSPKLRRMHSDDVHGKEHLVESLNPQAEARSRITLRSAELRNNFQGATVVEVSPSIRENYQGTYLVTLDAGDRSYEDLSCIQLLPINFPAKVRRALRALGVSASDKITLEKTEWSTPTYSAFLSQYVDLESPFLDSRWFARLSSVPIPVNEDTLRSLSSLESLEYLHTNGILPAEAAFTSSICLALPPLHPRTYSIASSSSYPPLPASGARRPPSSNPLNVNNLSILVKPLPSGRFSSTFLSTPTPTPLLYRLLPSAATTLLTLPPTTSILIIATGAGFAPVRSLLQHRIATPSHNYGASISLFLGLKHADVSLVAGTLNEAAEKGVLERMVLVGSNEQRVRVQDRLLEEGCRERVRESVVERGAWVLVCTGVEAVRGVRGAFERLIGEGGVEGLGERWVEEVF
ncbi:MAG: hypothetical protein Q9188_002023 [Gyalolechia gomerana]